MSSDKKEKKGRSALFTVLVILAIALVIFALFIPTILRAIPSRYVALLPLPLQELGVRGHAEALPTAAPAADTDVLEIADLVLEPTELPTVADIATVPPAVIITNTPSATVETLEPTFTPIPTDPPTPTAPPTPTPYPFLPTARIGDITHQFQSWNNCGPATLAMSLSHFDLDLKQEETASWLKPDPEDRNVSPEELVAYVNENTDLQSVMRVNGTVELLKRFITAGFPVIIETGIDPPGDYSWLEWYGHYYLVVAYDDSNETIFVYDSWLGSGENPQGERINVEEGRAIGYEDFDNHWRQFNRTFIVTYEESEFDTVADIIGRENFDDELMWRKTLERNTAELEADPENGYLWFNVGTIYNNLGEYELAAAAYDKARQIGLPWRMLWYQFGPYEAYYQTGRYQDVIELADVTLYQRPYFEESYAYRGLAKIAIGETSSGIRDLESAIEFNPRYQIAQEALDQIEQ